MVMTREFRFVRGQLRSEQAAGDQYLTGFAATYNNLSEILTDKSGSFRERIMPGAFARAVREKQDVRHLVNHDPSLLLGRTKSGTTELTDAPKGLRFRTRMPNTGYARDLAESVSRGDIDECSFGFVAIKDRWTSEGKQEIRELLDVDVLDVSIVTYPAYPSTTAEMSSRAMFPDGVPAEIRSHLGRHIATEDEWRRQARLKLQRAGVL